MRTIVALGCSLVCMLIIFVPEIVEHGSDMNDENEEENSGESGHVSCAAAAFQTERYP